MLYDRLPIIHKSERIIEKIKSVLIIFLFSLLINEIYPTNN